MSVAISESRALILAAGKGTRMKSDKPKAVMPLADKPMLVHVIESLVAAGVKHITIVVGYRQEDVRAVVPEIEGVSFDFAEQIEQKGTAHAVLSAEDNLKDHGGLLLVTNGDMPLIRSTTFREMLETHSGKGYSATVLSSEVDDPAGYGRLVRDEQGRLTHIVEEKDATDEIRKIKEVNSGTYVFQCPDVFDVIRRVGSDNKQNEYYLPDVVKLLRADGKETGSLVMADSSEALGANSPEELQHLEKLFNVRA